VQVVATLGVGAVLGLTATYKLTELRHAVAAVRRLGQYRLFERIGSGGMGEVYRAQHMFLRRPCAIKLIREDSQDTARSLQRFEREVQATASLHHPNIVDVYDYGRSEDGTFFYVMEYLSGMSLEQLVRRHGPLSAGRAVYLLRQACQALAEAHTVGLIHRDIKPSNLFVCSRGTQHDVVKLLDFGLVQQSDTAAKTGDDTPPVILSALPSVSLPPGMPSLPSSFRTLAGSILGTPSFMSPEQIRAAAPLDARSDLYSLGVVAFYLLTGHPPFRGATNVDVLAAHLTTPAPTLRSLLPSAPADLEALIARCLSKEPQDRPASASELEQALAACACASHWEARAAAAWWRSHGGPRSGEAKPEPARFLLSATAEQDATATAAAE
jgi:serine/threonine-protein kinase